MLWAGIVLPQLALDGVLRHHPDPSLPLALVTGPSQQRLITAANLRAREMGVRPGMDIPTARALATPLILREHDAAQASRLLQFLAAWAYRYSSLVSLEGDQGLLLEVGASLGLFGPWPALAARLQSDLEEAGFQHALALAPTPLAALVLARSALIAPARAPGAITELHELLSGLSPVPLTASGLPPNVISTLARTGLHSLGQCLALPRAGLARRFGQALLSWFEKLLGERADPRDCYQPPDEFIAALEFNHEVIHTAALVFPLRRMIGDLVLYLSRREYGVQHFMLELAHATLPPTRLEVGLRAPSREAAHLLALCQTRLERLALRGPVRGLKLMARDLPRFMPATRDLFSAGTETATAWEVLCDRLRARLGDDALFQLQPWADARPERGMQEVPLLVREPAIRYIPPRPGWLLTQPAPWHGQVRQILCGPERIEAGWWEGEEIRRDYYVVETDQGQRAWVFRQAGRQDGGWMLHGWFG